MEKEVHYRKIAHINHEHHGINMNISNKSGKFDEIDIVSNKTQESTEVKVENNKTEEPKQEENKTEEKIESDKVTEKEPPEKEENKEQEQEKDEPQKTEEEKEEVESESEVVAEDFIDVPKEHWAYDNVKEFSKLFSDWRKECDVLIITELNKKNKNK